MEHKENRNNHTTQLNKIKQSANYKRTDKKRQTIKKHTRLFSSIGKIENIHTVEKGDSDHIPMIAKIQLNKEN